MGYIIRKRVSKESFTDLIIQRLGISIDELKEFQEKAAREKKNVLQILVEQGYSEEEIAKIKAEYFGFTYDKLTNYIPEDYLLGVFDKNFLKNRLVLPLSLNNGVLILAMVEPSDIITVNEVVEMLSNNGHTVSEVSVIITTKQ